LLCTLTPEVQCQEFYRNHVIWRTKITKFWRNENDSKQPYCVAFHPCRILHHQRKTICLYVYISDIRHIVGYRTPVFIQRFPWRLHITITYNLPHLRLWHRKSPADLFRRQDKKKTERGRNWHDSKQPYCIVVVTIPAVVRLHDII
jgi:hypothetical protein